MKLRRKGDLLEPSNVSCTTSSSLASSAWLPSNRVHGPNSDMSGANLTKDIEVRGVDLLVPGVGWLAFVACAFHCGCSNELSGFPVFLSWFGLEISTIGLWRLVCPYV